MGQTATGPAVATAADADLPDPMGTPRPAAVNTDDLLSELAGQEIDRLLAESDAEPAGELPRVAPVTPPIAAETIAPPHAVPTTTAALHAVLEPVAAQAADRAAPHEPAVEVPHVGPTEPVVGQTPADIPEALRPTDGSHAIDLGEELDRVPALLAPLVWLNAPFDACPPRVREALGKVAVVTMLNAVAVIAYVLVFRRHH